MAHEVLLTLDLATNVGWSYGVLDDPRFAYGTHTLPSTGDDIGSFLSAYQTWFVGNAMGAASLVVFESPILPGLTSLATCRKLYGLAGVTEMLCKQADVRCLEVSAGACRAFLGAKRFRGDKPHALKQRVIEAVRRHGYEPADSDQADAIAIRLYVIARMFPQLMAAFSLDMGALSVVADN